VQTGHPNLGRRAYAAKLQAAYPTYYAENFGLSYCINQRTLIVREGNLLGPHERMGVLIVCRNESVDLFADLARRGEIRDAQGVGRENGEPDLDLVEPRGMRRREIKVDIFVPGQPAVVSRLVSVQVVQDHADFLARMLDHHLVHKVQKTDPVPVRWGRQWPSHTRKKIGFVIDPGVQVEWCAEASRAVCTGGTTVPRCLTDKRTIPSERIEH
jgi:hypothetical protein